MDYQISSMLLLTCVILYLYRIWKNAYLFFEKLGIPYLKPNFLFGNMTDAILLRKSLVDVNLDLYRKLEPYKFAGIFNSMKATVMIRDPELLKHVLVKDFAYFSDRGINVDEKVDPLGYHLFTMKGDEWKNLRVKLTSTFSSGKMKMMFSLVKDCGENFSEVIDQISANETFDMKDLSSRYTTDTIASCAFGLESKTLNNPKSEFKSMVRKLLQFRIFMLVRVLWTNMPMKLIKFFNMTFFDSKAQKFLGDIVHKTIKYREQNNVTRNDFLDLLIALKNNTLMQKFQDTGDHEDIQTFLEQVGGKCLKSDIEMTNNLLAAQCILFFAAGYEAASTTLGFTLLELALNPHIQNKVRQEILDVLSTNDGQLTYDLMKQMTYTDMVISESLRKYPTSAILFRRTCQNYKIPGSDVIIPAETPILIPVYGIHLDEKYYDNPQEFRPERFTEQEKAKRSKYTYLPFGEGPRNCLAKRFGKMQVKLGLIYALKDFSYQVSPKMKFPLTFKRNFGLLTVDGIWLQRQKL
uniref:Cytochrome P450 6PZ26 n=1 Tax=Maconellicoccus hirsutus TaxID=177089 RepID=A0AAT9UTT9_MACHI